MEDRCGARPGALMVGRGRGRRRVAVPAAVLLRGLLLACLGLLAARGPSFLGGGASSTAAPRPCSAGHATSSVTTRALSPVDEEAFIEIWDQTTQELALDVRELLITDANIYFVGPDVMSYKDSIDEVAHLLNYTSQMFDYKDLITAMDFIGQLENVFTVPPLMSVQRWPWAMLMQGLVVWVDPDGFKPLNVYDRDRVRKLKFPKKKAAFGPEKGKALSINSPSENLPADPIDMWMEADVHVDLKGKKDVPVTKLMLASMINSIMESPPKWRGWMKQAKTRGTIPANYRTPFEERRAFHSNGISPRLNRLLTE